MRQRAIIVLTFLLAGAFLLMLSSNSHLNNNFKTSRQFSPVLVDTTPNEAEDAQMLQLHLEARYAMHILVAKHATEYVMSKKYEAKRFDHSNITVPPSEALSNSKTTMQAMSPGSLGAKD